jgi:mannosyltransferase
VPVLLAVLAAAGVLIRSRGLPAGPAGDAFVIGGVWAIVGPVVLWTLSQAKPLFDLHYVIFCLPGTALLLASLPWVLAGRLPQLGAVALVLLVAVLGLPQQAAYRDPQTGHAEDLRDVAGYLRTHALPGDAVLFDEPNLRVLSDAYRQDLRGLRDVGLARGAVASDTLFGVSIAPGQVPTALASALRVWLVRGVSGPDRQPGSTEAAAGDALAGHYTARSQAQISTLELTLYVRTP